MVVDTEDLRLRMEMVNAGHLHTSGGGPEGGVLDSLEFSYGGGGSIREPSGGRVSKKGSNEGFVG